MYYSKTGRNLFLSVIVFSVLILSIFLVNYFNDNNSDIKQKKFDVSRIGVLDGEKLKLNAICFGSHVKIEEMVSNLLLKIRKAESETKTSYEKIKNNSKLSQKERNKELAKIESKWNSSSIKYNSEMQAIRKLDLKLSELIQKKLTEVIDSLAKSAKLDVIINKGSRDMINVFYSSKNVDITDIIIKKMDDAFPNIDLKELKQ